MRCHKCSTENSERRRFCRECGSLIVIFCRRCGFHNSPADKYCGGCGAGLVSQGTSAASPKGSMPSQVSSKGTGKYSAADINELIKKSPGEDDVKKKKDGKEDDEVSQKLIDKIFDSDYNAMDEEER